MDLDMPAAPFGRMLTAMVTPFKADGALDLDGAQQLATHLVDSCSHDGLVINGTTGEAPTTTDAEKADLVRAVVEAVGDRAKVIAGVGTNDTAHTVHLAKQAAEVGAHALLVVSPYYNKPPQAGLIQHFTTVADSTDLPVMLYDIPGRTAVAIETETLVRLAEHPRIVANKDAKGDLAAASWVRARTDLALYSGDDIHTLPFLSIGYGGVVSVVGHVAGNEIAAMISAFLSGDTVRAAKLHEQLLPAFTGFFRTQGLILTKAALGQLGLPSGPVRLPLVDATPEQIEVLRRDCAEAGLPL
jgi:4-hydroxy-tetrahydrodipicolinate synthase